MLNSGVANSARWLQGARPRTLPAALAPVIARTGVAAYAGGLVWWKALLALVVALALQVAVDFDDDYPRTGSGGPTTSAWARCG